MSINPYAPPTAVVADVLLSNPERRTISPFFAVSLSKLTVMSLCTFGFYQLFWFYQHWRHIRNREGSRLLPALRAIFCLLFCYACFARIRDHPSDEPPSSGRLSALTLTVAWTVTSLLSRLPAPFLLVGFAAVVFLLPVQARANRINAEVAPAHDPNTSFGVLNWITIVVGGSLFVLGVIGLLLKP